MVSYGEGQMPTSKLDQTREGQPTSKLNQTGEAQDGG